jgi:hypothetical protein
VAAHAPLEVKGDPIGESIAQFTAPPWRKDLGSFRVHQEEERRADSVLVRSQINLKTTI